MLLGAGSLILAACNDFLDELPDNRTELDTPDKINRLLVSAYPSRSFTRMCEIASDRTILTPACCWSTTATGWT